MNVKYALIQNDKIIKFKTVDSADTIILPKLLSHGYRKVIEQSVPEYDNITQILEDHYDIEPTQIVRRWTIIERDFFEAQQMKKDSLKSQTLDRIEAALDFVEEENEILNILNVRNEIKIVIDIAKTNQDLRNIIIGEKI